MRKLFLCLLVFSVLAGCSEKKKAYSALLTNPNLVHRNVDQLTQVIIHDMFSPPVASRIYAYTSMAAFEALPFEKE